MSEHALHFVIRCCVWWWQGGNFPLSLWFLPFCLFSPLFVGMSAQSRTEMMIIPLPSGGATGAGGGGKCPPMISILFVCLFVLVVSSNVGHGHDSTPTPLFNFLDKFLKSDKNVSESPTPPPPPPHTHTHTPSAEQLLGLAQQ